MQNKPCKYIVSWREWIAGLAIYFERSFTSERLARRELRQRKRNRRLYSEVCMREEIVK